MMIRNLPAEILKVIFNHLSEEDTVKSIQLVCKKCSGLAYIKLIALHTYPTFFDQPFSGHITERLQFHYATFNHDRIINTS
jgi:hypothetical protein